MYPPEHPQNMNQGVRSAIPGVLGGRRRDRGARTDHSHRRIHAISLHSNLAKYLGRSRRSRSLPLRWASRLSHLTWNRSPSAYSLRAATAGEPVVAVCHAGVIMASLRVLFDIPHPGTPPREEAGGAFRLSAPKYRMVAGSREFALSAGPSPNRSAHRSSCSRCLFRRQSGTPPGDRWKSNVVGNCRIFCHEPKADGASSREPAGTQRSRLWPARERSAGPGGERGFTRATRNRGERG